MSNEITVGTDRYWYSHFTGAAKGVRRWTESTVSGSGSTAGVAYEGTGGGGGSVSISTTHTEYCEFFLTDGKEERRFRVSGFYKAFLDGHRLTTLWLGRQGKDKGDVVYIRNLTTGEDEFASRALDELLALPLAPTVRAFGKLVIYGGWLVFLGLGAAVVVGTGVWALTHSGFFTGVFALAAWVGPPAAFYFWLKKRNRERQVALMAEVLGVLKGTQQA